MHKSALYALQRTLPIMAGFFPLGIAWGILMAEAGYGWLWTGLTSVTVFAGSLQFLMLTFFAGGVPVVTMIVMALLLNSRHITYGLSFIESFRRYGPWKYFLIYSLSDENYSLLCAFRPQPGTDERTVNVLSSALVVLYWVAFTSLGAALGRLITLDTTGLDFALTALFVVILLDQMRGAPTLLPAGIAAFSAILCLLIFGPAGFILPSLVITVAALLVLRPRLARATAEAGE